MEGGKSQTSDAFAWIYNPIRWGFFKLKDKTQKKPVNLNKLLMDQLNASQNLKNTYFTAQWVLLFFIFNVKYIHQITHII